MDKITAYLEEIIRLLKTISVSTGTSADDSYQFPQPSEIKFQLDVGETYSRQLFPKRKLKRLQISAPAGIVVLIHKDGRPWRRYTNIFTYDDLVNGEYFNQFDIIVENAGDIPTSWNVVAVFS